MTKKMININTLYKILAYGIITIMLLIIIFNNFMMNAKIQEKLIHISIVGIIIILFIIINKFILIKVNRGEKIILFSLLILFLILEIISVIYFRVFPSWEFQWIVNTASEIANTGHTNNMFYFQIYPNNIGALIIATISMWLTNGSNIGAYITNILLILLSAIFTMLTAKKIGGYKLAINALLMMLMCCPVYLYAPIVYTDTMSIFIPIATIYFWILAKESNTKKKYFYWYIISFLTVLGYIIKPFTMIVYVAIIIETILCNRKYLKHLLVSILLFILLFTSYKTYQKIFIIQNSELTFPYTHWIMLGLNKPVSQGGNSFGWGTYNINDFLFTKNMPTTEKKKEANIIQIKSRLNDLGVTGYINFLYNKFIYTWNDGSYFVFNKIGFFTLNKDSILYDYVLGQKSTYTLKPYINHYHQFMMTMMLIAVIIDFKNKRNDTIRVIETSIIGLAIFLLFWETRSRYIYTLIPVFCVLSAYGIHSLFNEKNKHSNIS